MIVWPDGDVEAVAESEDACGELAIDVAVALEREPGEPELRDRPNRSAWVATTT